MLQEFLDRFKETRQATLKLAENLTQEQLDRAPAAGKWSVGEVMDHVRLAEKLYRDSFEKLIALKKSGQKAEITADFSDIDVSIMFIPKSLLPLFNVPFSLMSRFVPDAMRNLMMRNRMVPAQAPTRAVPRKGRAIAELRADLQAALEETLALFRANSGLDYAAMRFFHPLLGSNHVPGMLNLMIIHEQRHQDQIREVLRALGLPRAV